MLDLLWNFQPFSFSQQIVMIMSVIPWISHRGHRAITQSVCSWQWASSPSSSVAPAYSQIVLIAKYFHGSVSIAIARCHPWDIHGVTDMVITICWLNENGWKFHGRSSIPSRLFCRKNYWLSFELYLSYGSISMCHYFCLPCGIMDQRARMYYCRVPNHSSWQVN